MKLIVTLIFLIVATNKIAAFTVVSPADSTSGVINGLLELVSTILNGLLGPPKKPDDRRVEQTPFNTLAEEADKKYDEVVNNEIQLEIIIIAFFPIYW